jgi:hypothetical protein
MRKWFSFFLLLPGSLIAQTEPSTINPVYNVNVDLINFTDNYPVQVICLVGERLPYQIPEQDNYQ